MKKILAVMSSIATASLFLIAPNSQATSPQSIVTTCTDLNNHKTSAIKASEKGCNPFLAPATWHIQQSDSAAHSGAGFATLRICTSKNPEFTYQYIKSSCPKYQVTTDYWRSIAKPGVPLIASISARGYDSALFTLSPTIATTDAPIAYYLVTNIKTGQVNKLTPNNLSQLSLINLSASTSYTFQIAAVSVDGTSPSSTITEAITTGAIPVVAPTAPALAAPAFTLSAASETRTVNTAATGFTTSSTGGAIASFAISATPAGMSFSTSTGALTGTPTSVAGATAYTITATNATGSATQTFTLTVTAVVYTVGQRGPGGGIVFYVSATNFTSTGSTCNTACKYLEVAPSTWKTGSFANDPSLAWSTDITTVTGQDTTTASTEGIAANAAAEKFNWKIGQGFYNTSVMKVSGATSAAQAAVLAYAATDSSAGQWFIPSTNELNELCKYARGQTTGDPHVACDSTGTLKTGTSDDLGGFNDWYWSSSERIAGNAWYQTFGSGAQIANHRWNLTYNVRPIRAF